VAAAGGILGLVFVGMGLRESRYATVASNRGWLAVETATIPDPLKLNQPIEYVISFKNSGKSPATDQQWSDEYGTVSAPVMSKDGIIDFNDIHLTENKTCDHLTPTDTNDVIYPDDSEHRNLSTTKINNYLTADQPIIDGTRYIYLRGCIAYRTMGIVGKSGYCYIVLRFTDKRGLTQEIHKCPSGISAE
jgi:hypothetical protein